MPAWKRSQRDYGSFYFIRLSINVKIENRLVEQWQQLCVAARGPNTLHYPAPAAAITTVSAAHKTPTPSKANTFTLKIVYPLYFQ